MGEKTNRIIKDRDAFWAAEMAKLKEALGVKNVQFDGSQNIGSQQGRCSKGRHDNLKLDLVIKKKLDLTGDGGVVEEKCVENEKNEVDEKNDVEQKNEVEEKTEKEVDDRHTDAVLLNKDISLWELAIGSLDNIGCLCNSRHGQ